MLQEIAAKTNLKIDFGGGLKSDEDLRIAFDNGASQITGGSIAVKNPDIFTGWLTEYGSDKIILGADCINRKIATHGWLETSEVEVIDFIIKYEKLGIKNTICTDVAKDGMLQGASVELYQEILSKSGVNLIASGGVANIDDLIRLKEIGCEGTILGKAIYENRISLKQLENFIIK